MHKHIIRANNPWWRIPFREIWDYRDLIGIMWIRDMSALYKQSILGPFWFILQPLLTTLVFTVIFGNVARIGTDGVPSLLFYMSGMLIWNFFATCLNSTAVTLVSNIHLFGKVYFPRLIVPLVKILAASSTLALNAATFAAFWLFYRFYMGTPLPPVTRMFCFFPIILYAAMLGMGTGLLLTSLTVKYRDIQFFLPIFAQLWMYASPIVYPASMVPEGWRWVILYNPMSWAVEATRWALVGKGSFDLSQVAISVTIGVIIFWAGLVLFNRVQRTFVDTV
ncbi:MAG: ABC transporter permease [Kiritimatiellae bacterium]|nr:ABC transporter permease [Kiritimatiellia bacterium]